MGEGAGIRFRINDGGQLPTADCQLPSDSCLLTPAFSHKPLLHRVYGIAELLHELHFLFAERALADGG
jgi:hypothetical protein